MELLLNLAWAAFSLSLLVLWLASLRNGTSSTDWRVIIAFALLVVLLFPVISMTDDLAAINNPAEAEHIFRRSVAPLLHGSAISPLGLIFGLLLLLLFASFTTLLASTRFTPASPLTRLLAGFLRSCSVRPPPSPGLA